AKAELFIKLRHACTEPEEFDFLEARVIQDALDDLGADPLALVGLIDDHIPDGCSVDIVREYPSKPDQHVTVPGRYGDIGMAQHFTCVLEGPTFGPRCLLVEADQLGRVEVFLLNEGDGGLEAWGDLVLGFLSVAVTKISRRGRGTSLRRK